MSWTRSTMFVFLAVFAAALCTPTPSRAQSCSAEAVSTVTPPDAPGAPPAPATTGNGGVGLAVSAAPAGGPTLNQEGLTERPADLLIFDNGALTHCFPAGRQIIITYNAALTTPNPVPVSGSNLDVMDSSGASGLVINVTTSVGLSTFNTPQTVITITVLQAGTAGNLTTGYTGSAVRLKNLRFDVTSLVGAADPHVYATVSTSNPVDSVVSSNTQPSGSALLTVGQIAATIGSAEHPGDEDFGVGFQSTPTGLCNESEFDFTEGFGGAFRTAITSQAVYRDIPTTATSLIFNVTNIPAGVTVTFPSSLANSVSGGGGIAFAARSTTLSATGGSLSVIYDTSVRSSTPATLTAITADKAATVTSTSCDLEDGPCGDADEGVVPSIGVAVSSSTGFGTASITALFGPTPTGGANDDVQPTAIPRYLASTASNSGGYGKAPSRLIFTGPFFQILPVQTVLLYPYVTDNAGYQTGLEIANTGASNSIFNSFTCDNGEPDPPVTKGPITFWFFPNGGTPFSYTPTDNTVVTRGLDASGNLNPGNVMAVSLDALLSAAGQSAMVGSFDGYVLAVAEFNFAHGYSIIFDPSGHGVGSASALVVGPFEDQTRSGQLSLPESLGSIAKKKH